MLGVVALGLGARCPQLIPYDFLEAEFAGKRCRAEGGAVVHDQPSTIVIHDMMILSNGRAFDQVKAIELVVPKERREEA